MMLCDLVYWTYLCPELEQSNQTPIPHFFFNVIGLAEIQVLSGYFAIWFQESDEVSTCLTVERQLFEGV